MKQNGTDVGRELQRLQQFRTQHERVELPGGEHVYVRQLSPADAILLSVDDPEAGLKTLALSLCTEDGARLFGRHDLETGISVVGEWPAEYVDAMNPVMARLNGHADSDGSDPAEVIRQD